MANMPSIKVGEWKIWMGDLSDFIWILSYTLLIVFYLSMCPNLPRTLLLCWRPLHLSWCTHHIQISSTMESEMDEMAVMGNVRTMDNGWQYCLMLGMQRFICCCHLMAEASSGWNPAAIITCFTVRLGAFGQSSATVATCGLASPTTHALPDMSGGSCCFMAQVIWRERGPMG